MSRDEDGERPEASDWLPALSFAAALWCLVARVLPLRFDYHPNTLGIVSFATQRTYPTQQETIWYALSMAAGGLIALGLSAAFARAASRVRDPAPLPAARAGAELAGVAALACVLALPPGIAAAGVAASLAAAFALLARAGGAASVDAVAQASPPLSRARWIPLLLVGAALLTPPAFGAAFDVARGAPDASLARDTWPFHAELGQHLAWADAMRRGGLQGRDFFALYGPLYTPVLVGLWALLGRSLAVANLWDAGMHVAGLALVLGLAGALVRRRALVLVVPFLVLFANLRVALPLAALLPLLLWLRRRGDLAPACAGALTAAALLFSPEFGSAGLVASALALALLGAGRAAVAFAAGAAAVVALVFGFFASHGALGAMLEDLVSYPRWMIAGFGKLPFPSPLVGLPLDPARLVTADALVLRMGLATAAIFAGALLLLLPRAPLAAGRVGPAWRALGASVGAAPARFAALWLGVFGAIAFRSALGRSDLTHVTPLAPIAALLVVLAADRTLEARRTGALAWPVAGTRLAALALLAWTGGFVTLASPLSLVRASAREASARWRGDPGAPGDAHVAAVAERIRALSAPDGAIFVLPNSGAYYYLAERRNPTRFALAHQMVTNAHRAEALAALRANPPALVVWDDAGVRVDGIDDARVLGPALRRWLDAEYELAERVGGVRLLRPRAAVATPAP